MTGTTQSALRTISAGGGVVEMHRRGRHGPLAMCGSMLGATE